MKTNFNHSFTDRLTYVTVDNVNKLTDNFDRDKTGKMCSDYWSQVNLIDRVKCPCWQIIINNLAGAY